MHQSRGDGMELRLQRRGARPEQSHAPRLWLPGGVVNRMRGLLTVLLLGCVSGANPETLVDELRVVAIVAEPPEAAPG